MNIFTLHPNTVPKAIVLLPENKCNKASAQWLLTRVIQPAVLSIQDIAFGGVKMPNKSKLSKAEIVEELQALHEYCETYGVETIVVGHAELFKYLTNGAKFTLNFGRAVKGEEVKVAKGDNIDFTHCTVIPFLNPVILEKYPNKATEVAKGLSVINKIFNGDYSDNVEFHMDVEEVITDVDRAIEVLRELYKAPQLASDIETTGLDWFRSRLLTVSLSPNKDVSYCFAMDAQYTDEATATKMKKLIGRFFMEWDGEFIGHNFTGFDVPFLIHMIRGYDFSVPVAPIINKFKLTDTMLMAYILNNSTERVSIGLKPLSFKYMGEYDSDIDQSRLELAPLEKVGTYNNYDCRATWLIYEELFPRIKEEGFEEAYNTMNDIGYDLVKMKMEGLRVDYEKTKLFKDELKELTKKDREALLENEFVKDAQRILARRALKKYNATHVNKKTVWQEFEEPFNPNSTKQKQVLFFELMQLPIIETSRTTKLPSANASTISAWLDDDSIEEEKIEAIKLVSEYMTAQKISSTYVDVIVEKALEVAPNDYRIFTNFNQTATITGRLSSSGDINLQTIPNSSKYGKRVKELFIAPDGFILGTADYNALEDRLIANESQDENKLATFLKNIDGHCLNAYGYFKEEFKARGLEYDITDPNSINKMKEEAPDLRQDGKPYTFGFTYGAGPQKYGKDLYDAYWETYSGVKRYNDGVIRLAMKQGYLISKFSGLRLWLPSINASDDFIQSKEWRVACNFTIQSGNYLMLIAIHKMQRWIEENDLTESVKLILTVHDSVYLYVKEDVELISRVNKALIDFMGENYDENQTLPLTAELDIGTNMVNFKTLSTTASVEDIVDTLDKIKEA